MWANNRFLEELKGQAQKARAQKMNNKELDSAIITIGNCLNSNVQATQYDKLINYFVQIFVASTHLLPNDALYRSFKGVIECGPNEAKSKKAYLVVKNVIEVCERVYENGGNLLRDPQMEKNYKAVLGLVKKSGQKQFGPQIYNAFLDYYLERLQTQLGDKGSTKLGLKVLSDLATILTVRYKTHFINTMKKQLNSSHSLLPLFLLIEFQNNPVYIISAIEVVPLSAIAVILHRYEISPELTRAIKSKFMSMFAMCFKMNLPDTLLIIPTMYPLLSREDKPIDDIYELIDRIYLDTFMEDSGLLLLKGDTNSEQNWKSMKENEFSSLNMFWVKKSLRVRECFKINILFLVIFGSPSALAHPEKQIQSLHSNDFSHHQDLVSDCLQMIDGYITLKLNQTPDYPSAESGKVYPVFNKRLMEMVESNNRLREYLRQDSEMENMDLAKVETEISENWKSYIATMFELLQEEREALRKQKEEKLKNINNCDEYYNKMCQFSMSYFGIRPPTVQRQISARQKQLQSSKLFQTSKLTNKCLQVLEKIIIFINNEDLTTELISHMKKVMSSIFDKVSETVIKDIISSNLFYCKCLLLTNHAAKCKILFDVLLKKGSSMTTNCLREELTFLLKIPESVILEYARFLSSRDRLKFRVELYEAEMTKLEYLADICVADLVVRE